MNSGSWYWPDLSYLEGAKDASRVGMWCALIVSGATALFALLSIFGTSVAGTSPLALVDAAFFGAIALGIYRFSRFAAVAGFVLFLLERIYSVIQAGTVLGAGVLGVILLIGFLNGVRRTFAYKKLLAAPQGTVPPAMLSDR
jgi:hypothetical protein